MLKNTNLWEKSVHIGYKYLHTKQNVQIMFVCIEFKLKDGKILFL